MNVFHVEILVALAPALACVVLCVVANIGAIRALFTAKVTTQVSKALNCREHVNTMLSAATNLMFVGSAVGVLYGSDGERPLDKWLGVLVGLTFGLVVAGLSRRAAFLAKKEADEQSEALRDAVREAVQAQRRQLARASKRRVRRAPRRR